MVAGRVVQKVVGPVIGGGTPRVDFEVAAEVVLAGKAQLPTDFLDREVAVEEQAGGGFHFEVIEVPHRGHVHVALK